MADALLDLLGVSAPASTSTTAAGTPGPVSAAAPAQDPLLALLGVAPASPASRSGTQAIQSPASAPATPAATGFGAQLGNAIADVPHQLGLTARYAIEGGGGMLDTLASPIRGALNMIPGVNIKPAAFPQLADALHLPTPQNATERVVGDASRMVAGAMLPVGLARGAGTAADAMLASRAQAAANGAAPTASGALRATAPIAQAMSASPGMQAVSAAAAGGAGGYAREQGATPGAQTLASVAASLAAPAAAGALGRLGGATQSLAQRIINPSLGPAQIDAQIGSALQASGMTLGDLPTGIRDGIRADVVEALKTSDTVSPAAIRRLADYRLTGATPTAASLTLDPAMVSQQKNLAKLGINSKDAAAQTLGRVENANNQQLVTGLNNLGADTVDDALVGGSKLIDALGRRNTQAQAMIDEQYAAARASDGRSALLDHNAFVDNANNLLDKALLGGKVPSDVRQLLKRDWTNVIRGPGDDAAAADGVKRNAFDVDTVEQMKSSIADLQRVSTNGTEIKALGLVRQALDDTPLLPGQDIGQEAIDAFNKARTLHRTWMGTVEKTPALEAIRAGVEPDKFVQQYVIGSTNKADLMDVAMLKNQIANDPEAMGAVRNQITSYLKSAALGGSSDEAGKFSQSSYNRALRAVGDNKLRLFFPQEDINQLKAIGRVASYEQFQPAGAAVNNSNTAPTMMSAVLDRIGNSPLLSKVPFGKSFAEPMQNISTGIKSGRAMNVPAALGAMPVRPTAGPNPLRFTPALLMAQPDDQEKKKGLLFP